MRHRSFTASEKLKITEEEETEIGLLEKKKSMSAKAAYVIDEELNSFS
jgi:hypothetical protein